MKIRIAGIIPESVVDGPGGISYTIFAQGCSHNCKGCHNPSTHNFQSGQIVDCSFILKDIKRFPLSKIVTFTGGDPFFQVEGFSYLAKELKKIGYIIVAYTGFTFDDIIIDNKKKELLNQIDILIDGPFIEKLKNIELPFRGSSNQRIIDIKRTLAEGSLILDKRHK